MGGGSGSPSQPGLREGEGELFQISGPRVGGGEKASGEEEEYEEEEEEGEGKDVDKNSPLKNFSERNLREKVVVGGGVE